MSKPRPVPDQPARDLIRARLDINLLVEAGAGSGKTECLAQRMAAGVLEGRYTVEEMAAVTFTRKAAAELRGRFQLTLERALADERDETGGSAPGRPCATSSGSSPAPSTRSAPTCSASARWRPGWRRASPSWTRSPSTTSGVAPGATIWTGSGPGSPALRELLEAGVKPPDLDKAFEPSATTRRSRSPWARRRGRIPPRRARR